MIGVAGPSSCRRWPGGGRAQRGRSPHRQEAQSGHAPDLPWYSTRSRSTLHSLASRHSTPRVNNPIGKVGSRHKRSAEVNWSAPALRRVGKGKGDGDAEVRPHGSSSTTVRYNLEGPGGAATDGIDPGRGCEAGHIMQHHVLAPLIPA